MFQSCTESCVGREEGPRLVGNGGRDKRWGIRERGEEINVFTQIQENRFRAIESFKKPCRMLIQLFCYSLVVSDSTGSFAASLVEVGTFNICHDTTHYV